MSVPGREAAEVADRVSELLLHPDRAAAVSAAGPGSRSVGLGLGGPSSGRAADGRGRRRTGLTRTRACAAGLGGLVRAVWTDDGVAAVRGALCR